MLGALGGFVTLIASRVGLDWMIMKVKVKEASKWILQ